MERRKRATMMLDSDDEVDDILGDLHQPKPKKRKESQKDIPDIAEGPSDFIQALTDSGFYPRTGNHPNLLGVPQSDFQQKLREHLVNNLHFPRNIEFFVAECDQFLSEKNNLIKALHPTENATEESSNVITLPQDSLVHLLLNIDEIQPKLMASILKKFSKIAREDKPGPNEANLPSLLLSQMAWLNRIVDPALIVDTLLDLLSTTSSAIKKEIIANFPGLVADKEQIRVAFALCELLNENTNSMTGAILDALGDLNLPAIEAAELRGKVVKRILAVPLETIPVLLSFIFKRIQNDEAGNLIDEVRQNLDKAFKNKRNERTPKDSINDCISLSVEALQNAMIRSKPLGDIWFKEIQSKNDPRQHFCVDLLVLIVQHKLTGRRRAVEMLLRKKLRSEILTTELLRAIADSLLLTSDPLVVSQGSLFYQEMFVHFDEFFQQEVVEALIQHVCCGGESAASPDSPATAALVVLQELSESNWLHLVRFSAFIVTLLEYIEYMALPQVKRVMELLAKMAYGFASTDEPKTKLASFSASIQSELLMIIKKQLSHTRVEFQRMGVIGSVALIHVLANPDLVGEASPDMQLSQAAASVSSTDSRRTGVLTGDERLSLAKSMIDLVHASTKRVPEISALFMDEMASTSLLHDIHPSLYSYLYDSVSETFQENFVVDEDEQQIHNLAIPLSLQYGLDAVEEENSNLKLVFLNIAPMAIREQSRKAGERSTLPTLTTLMSHFRLLRNTIDSFEQASLEDIDALLGCALCLPKEDIMDEYDMMTPNEKDLVCRCFFYAFNWLIEVINTFARSKTMRAKVIQRLRDVVELKEKFYKCLSKNPTFMPPPSVFFGEPVRSRTNPIAPAGKKAVKKPAGKKKGGKKGQDAGKDQDCSPNKSVIHSTPINSMHLTGKLDFTTTQGGSSSNVNAGVVHSAYIIHFREFDLSAFLLLSSSLELSGNASPASISLKPKDLELLLADLSGKLEHKLLSAASKRRFPLHAATADKESFVMLDLYSPLDVARRTIPLIRRLTAHLETVSGYFQQLIELSDGVLDGPEMYTDGALCLSNCYYLIFRVLTRMFSWHEFQKPSGGPLLEDGLKYLATRLRENAKSASFSELHSASFDYIEKFSGSVPTFACAVEHVNLLCTLHRILPTEEQAERLASVAEKFLKRTWHVAGGELEKGPKFNQGIESMLQIYLMNGSDMMDKLEVVVKTAMTDVLESNSDELPADTNTFRTCNKGTFPVYFRATLLILVEVVKKIHCPSSSSSTVQSTLAAWAKSIDILNHLVLTVKTLDRRSILISCLKHGRAVVEHFYKSAMPLLDKQFKNFPIESQELLKSLQVSTRTLQSVCNHAKTSRDASLAVHVPAIKRVQEQLLYRVKAMLAANGCASAFWAGNLKNKNLKGQEILSQSINGDSEDEAGNDQSESDEGDHDDEDDDVTVMNDNAIEEDEDSRSREF